MKRKILVVDDETSLLKVTLLRLSVSGYEALGAEDGEAGLKLARQKMPDLIILDVILPGMCGDEIAKILKKDEGLKHIPVILISAEIETLEERARKSGADCYLSKPFDTKELLSAVERLLASSHIR